MGSLRHLILQLKIATVHLKNARPFPVEVYSHVSRAIRTDKQYKSARMQGMKLSMPFFRTRGLSRTIEIGKHALRIPQILRYFDFLLCSLFGKWRFEICHGGDKYMESSLSLVRIGEFKKLNPFQAG